MVEGTLLQNVESKSYIHLIDPVIEVHQDVVELAGIGESCPDGIPSISPDGRHIWVGCSEGSYLIYLEDHISLPFEDVINVISWSPTGRFALLASEWDLFNKQGTAALFDILYGTRLPFSEQRISKPTWNPGEDILAYYSEDNSSIEIIELPSRREYSSRLNYPIKEIAWHPVNNRLALLLEDGSLWVNYHISSDNMVQLTPSLTDARDLSWSQLGEYLAFVSGMDLYVVKVPDANY
jgi:WD40 repeat protein